MLEIEDAEAVISMTVLKRNTLPVKAHDAVMVMQFSQHRIPANERPIGSLIRAGFSQTTPYPKAKETLTTWKNK